MSQTKAQLLEPTGVFTLTNQLVGVGATFSGNVSIAGTLTKQDVTNVDSVGVITARSGVNVTGGNVHVGQGGSGANNAELKLQAGAGTGNDIIAFLNQAGATRGNLTYDTDNNFLLFNVNQGEKLRIDSNGYLSFAGNTNTYIHRPAADQLAITTGGGSEPIIRLATGGGGNTVGISTTNNMVTNAEVLAVYGTSSFKSNTQARPPLYLGNEGSTSGVANALILFNQGGANRGGIGYVPNTGELRFNNQYFLTFNTGVSSLDGTERLRITAAGLVGIGTINPTRGPLHVHENSTGDVQIHLTNQETGTTSSDGFTIFSGANAGLNAGFVNRESGGTIAFYTHNGSSVGVRLTLSHTGNLTSTGTVSDSKGELRSIPRELKGSTYTLVASDAGKVIAISSGGITVPHNVLGTGHAVTLINNSGTDQTITQAASLSMYYTADQSTGNRTLAGRGMATIWFSSGAEAYITGSGLS